MKFYSFSSPSNLHPRDKQKRDYPNRLMKPLPLLPVAAIADTTVTEIFVMKSTPPPPVARPRFCFCNARLIAFFNSVSTDPQGPPAAGKSSQAHLSRALRMWNLERYYLIFVSWFPPSVRSDSQLSVRQSKQAMRTSWVFVK